MGCDIHMHLEYRKPYISDNWVNGDYLVINPYWKDNGEQLFVDSDFETFVNYIPIYDGRCYQLFTLLAGVRNYFSEIDVHSPKGLPEDVTSITKLFSDIWGADGHSHSYFTLSQLIDIAKTIYIKGGYTKESLNNYMGDNRLIALHNLLTIIHRIKERCAELRIIQDYWWHKDKEKAYNASKDVRIVFWFDN